jgi:hypothetical protein
VRREKEGDKIQILLRMNKEDEIKQEESKE